MNHTAHSKIPSEIVCGNDYNYTYIGKTVHVSTSVLYKPTSNKGLVNRNNEIVDLK